MFLYLTDISLDYGSDFPCFIACLEMFYLILDILDAVFFCLKEGVFYLKTINLIVYQLDHFETYL